MVLWLHTAETENPDTPQTHPSASDFHEYHSDTPTHPQYTPQLDIPQTPPGSTTCKQKTTDSAPFLLDPGIPGVRSMGPGLSNSLTETPY